MFRRLEAYQSQEPFVGEHLQYIQGQEKYFKALPNVIPSMTSGLPTFDQAIQTTDTTSKPQYQAPAVPVPNDIFMAIPSPTLEDKARLCATSSLDDLIAIKNPSESVGCGWLYTPPPLNSPHALLSKGFIGKRDGPSPAFDPPAYKQWFFDLQTAKKQVLLDKCKALKACTDLDSEVFRGACGYCKNTNQGVPIDQTGQPLYPSDPRGGCDSTAIVRSAAQCPPPPPPPPGPAPMVDRTCDPVNGRLSAECLRRQVLAAGCTDQGALAIALSGASDPRHYLMRLNRSEALGMYQRVAQPPMNLDLFRQGQATIGQILQEVRQVAGNTMKPESTGLGLAARDLCLRQGAFNSYDPCSELNDNSPAPFSLTCLQQLFLRMGGHAAGNKYPSAETIDFYNAMGTWGAVRKYLQEMYRNMYVNTPSGPLKESFQDSRNMSGVYDTQRQAMIDFLGIVPEKAIERVPYRQGIEVFWFVVIPGNPRGVRGFLRRTIERDIVQLQAGPSRVSQLGGIGCGAMVQLFDVRAPQEGSVRFRVTVDDGFWIAINQPAEVDKKAMNQTIADEAGLFENLGLQGPTTYESKACTPLRSATPNIVKMFFEDAGCGWNAFQVSVISCSGLNAFQTPYYSLTLEERAPFLSYEVSEAGKFEERRNPGLFGQWFNGGTGVRVMYRSEERMSVPGKKGCIRVNSANSVLDMYNIAFQSWQSMTFAVRFVSMPVKETLLKIAPGRGYASLVLTPLGNNRIVIRVEHTFGDGKVKTQTAMDSLVLNTWYLFVVENRRRGMEIRWFNVGSQQFMDRFTIDHGAPMYAVNETWNPAPGQAQGQCTLMWGGAGFTGRWDGIYATTAFEYDIAWIHFFEQALHTEDIRRECMGDWKYTQFANSYGVYQGLKD